jgi:hypothetical protein
MGKTVKGITIPDTVYLDAQRATAPLAITSETEITIDLKSPMDPFIVLQMRWPLPDPQQALDIKPYVSAGVLKEATGSVVPSGSDKLEITLAGVGSLAVGAAVIVFRDDNTGESVSNELSCTIIDTTE